MSRAHPNCVPHSSRRRAVGRRTGLALVAGLATASMAPGVSQAIEPNDQFLPDPTTPLSLGASGLLTGGQFGTGTVIGADLKGTTGYVAILTANHVAAAGETGFSLGAGTDLPAFYLSFKTGSFKTFTITDPKNNPKDLPEDVSVILGVDNGLTKGSQALALFTALSKNLPTITIPKNNPFLTASATNKVKFTQIGYGLQGQFKGGATIDGKTYYQATKSDGQRLFENNLATSYTAPALVTYGDYFEPLVTFQVMAPNAQGQGGGLAGDSGGPLYTQPPSTPVFVNVNRDGKSIPIPITDTNSLSAIDVGFQAYVVDGKPVMPFISPVGSNQWGVPITQALYNWMQPYIANPQAIPEPSSAALVALGGLGLLAWKPRRRRAWALALDSRGARSS